MRYITALLFFFAASNYNFLFMSAQTQQEYTYLAIGDSYTIGESVPLQENFPNQSAAILLKENIKIIPRIIAKTGWTTDELEAGIIESNAADTLLSSYDFVSLLIGVNNQYRGRTADNYKQEFEELLKKAIRFAGNRPEGVIVLSIPDWGVTPYAIGRDRAEIAKAIDEYNTANKEITQRYHIQYIDITQWTRESVSDSLLVAGDGLHPSGKEYKRWAEKVADWMKESINWLIGRSGN